MSYEKPTDRFRDPDARDWILLEMNDGDEIRAAWEAEFGPIQ